MVNFKDLETKGFVVVNDFLSADQLDYVKNDYIRQKEAGYSSPNKNQYVIEGNYPFLLPIIQTILDSINAQTNLKINIIKHNAAFFDNQKMEFAWHQDHEPYYMFQDSYNALNFWIPIIKPDPKFSGINVIPQDKLQQSNPEIFNKDILGKGAIRYKIIGDKTLMFNDFTGKESLLLGNINDLGVSPEIKEGDVIILRHDILHKTQDQLTNRVSLSIRCYNKDTVLTRKHFLVNCKKKTEMMSSNPYGYEPFIEKFINEESEHILISDIIKP
jgi:hypothetical protein